MNGVGSAHAVFDPLGFESFDESHSILTPGGTLVAYGNNMDSLADKPPRDPKEAVIKLMARNSDSPTGKRATFFGLARDSPTYANDVAMLVETMKKEGNKDPTKKG
ncbi:uncharacterized protein PFLUO_LOCUS6906 [Penicillium psychrofluorescens]|uniref:uncharacterized protein n=1 Tax=Penicillium psychrofluorescens TaxID=3158075 RepID=UPI003CCD245D